MADEIIARLGWVKRSFATALVIGDVTGQITAALSARNIAITKGDMGALWAHYGAGLVLAEDALLFPPASFDLIITTGTLDQINDLPGALIQMRAALAADGLMLAAMFGAGSLRLMRSCMAAADGNPVYARIHPQIDVRAAGDLLLRAGYHLPVADMEELPVRYRNFRQLHADLRDIGASSLLLERAPPLNRKAYQRAVSHFDAQRDTEGRATETFALLYLSGWRKALP